MYISKSVEPLAEDDLTDILTKSHQNNAEKDITGVLLYVRGSIIQVLEGEKRAVETLFKRINQDQRHTDVDQVLDRPITQRLFSNWSMGYETITARQLEEIKLVIGLDHDHEMTAEQDHHIILKPSKYSTIAIATTNSC